MKIGILVTGHAPAPLLPKTGDYDQVFGRLLAAEGFETKAWDVVDMDFPDDVHDCDGWILSGSKHGAYEDLPFIPPLEDFIRAAFDADVPMVGICFGHQAIAKALGGTVEKFAGGWAVGRQIYQWGDQEIALNAWHQDQVTALPAGAEVIASNDFCRNAAVVYGRKAFTVQAHPEFDNDFIAGLAAHRGPGVVPEADLDHVKQNLDRPNDNAKLAQMMARFFRERNVA